MNEKRNEANLSSEPFCTELCNWLKERGFENDRGWKEKRDGSMFYSFVKNNIRFEIKQDWNLRMSAFVPVHVNILNCENECYSDNGYIGWLGQEFLMYLHEPFNRTFFNEICEYFGV